MRLWIVVALTVAVAGGVCFAEEPAKRAPKVVLKSDDGKKSYDLTKLAEDGPVLVRLTCACSGCDQELPYFQKLQVAYAGKGLRTLAVFKEQSATAKDYVEKNAIKFLWVADPTGEQWKTFDAKAMPTNILIDKGGRVVSVLAGCTRDGKNAQTLSTEIAKILKTDVAQIVESKPGR